MDVDARHRLIEKCAYLRAERRGFVGGDPEQDWLEAEMEIDQLLLQGWTMDNTESADEIGEPLALKPEPERRV